MSRYKCFQCVIIIAIVGINNNTWPSLIPGWGVAHQYRTKTIPVVKAPKVASEEAPSQRTLIYGVQEENGSHVQNFALDLTPPPEVVYKSEPGTTDGMNVLGIVIFSATMGTCCPACPLQCPGASPSLHPCIQ